MKIYSSSIAQYDIVLETKYDSARRFYIRIQASQLEDRELPPVFVNVYRKKGWIECQTLGLVQRNQKVVIRHRLLKATDDL